MSCSVCAHCVELCVALFTGGMLGYTCSVCAHCVELCVALFTGGMLGYTVLQSKRANFVVFKIFCYFQEIVQEGPTLSLWEDTSTCTALLEVTCCHVI